MVPKMITLKSRLVISLVLMLTSTHEVWHSRRTRSLSNAFTVVVQRPAARSSSLTTASFASRFTREGSIGSTRTSTAFGNKDKTPKSDLTKLFMQSMAVQQQQDEHNGMTSTDSFSTTSDDASAIGPYTTFQKLVLDRLNQADACEIFKTPLETNVDQPLLLPMVKFSDLALLAESSPGIVSDSDFEDEDIQERRQELVKTIQEEGGGCVLVELGSAEAGIIDDMWSSMEKVYHICDEEHYSLRHQILSRENTNSTPQLAHENQDNVKGYQFMTSYMDQGDFLVEPQFVIDILGMNSTWDLLGAYLLMERIGKDMSIITTVGAPTSPTAPHKNALDAQAASNLVQFLLSESEDNGESEGSGHRLCRYIAQGDGDGSAEQGLCTHTDWSLTTPLPVSSICGLEVYIPKYDHWVRPEIEARRHYNKMSEKNNNQDEAKERWNSKYAVVMVGKWVELMTNGTFKSCVHRVVAGKAGNPPRLSAPFFLRPREEMFVGIRERFDGTYKQDKPIKQQYCDLSSSEAINCMYDFVMEEYHESRNKAKVSIDDEREAPLQQESIEHKQKAYRPPKF